MLLRPIKSSPTHVSASQAERLILEESAREIFVSNRSNPEQSESQRGNSWIKHFSFHDFSIYYIANLLANMFLLSFYVIQVFGIDHQSCKTKSGHDIAEHFYVMFNAGFIILAIETLNSSIPYIFFRFKIQQRKHESLLLKEHEMYAHICEILEWLFRILMLAMSIV